MKAEIETVGSDVGAGSDPRMTKQGVRDLNSLGPKKKKPVADEVQQAAAVELGAVTPALPDAAAADAPMPSPMPS